MQIDFHHAAVYVLARLAGFAHAEAATVAHASQYVDDSNAMGTLHFTDGSSYAHIASAHKVFDLDHNANSREDYGVWLPFHFLPGNNGADYGTVPDVPLTQRLLCAEDSPIADAMWQHCRENASGTNALYRLGITAHVYLDTFSHQGFVGFRHKINEASHLAMIEPAGEDILTDIQAEVADLLALGHGGAYTYPDLPYLTWSYDDSFGQTVRRANPDAYLRASERLFAQFIYYRGEDPDTRLQSSDLARIEALITGQTEADGTVRHMEWMAQIVGGAFSFGALNANDAATLHYDAGSWEQAALGQRRNLITAALPMTRPAGFDDSPWKLFNDVLIEHQQMVLNELLPACQLPASYDAATSAGI